MVDLCAAAACDEEAGNDRGGSNARARTMEHSLSFSSIARQYR
jgi:hypothetical protein